MIESILIFGLGGVCGWAACYWAGRKNRALFEQLNKAGNDAADAARDALDRK